MVMHNALDKMSVTEGSLGYISKHECELGDPVNKYKCKWLAAFSLPLTKSCLCTVRTIHTD